MCARSRCRTLGATKVGGCNCEACFRSEMNDTVSFRRSSSGEGICVKGRWGPSFRREDAHRHTVRAFLLCPCISSEGAQSWFYVRVSQPLEYFQGVRVWRLTCCGGRPAHVLLPVPLYVTNICCHCLPAQKIPPGVGLGGQQIFYIADQNDQP